MGLLVVGSVAFDDVITPHGVAENALGGSASFAAYVASYYTQTRLVGVVGEDFPDEHRQLFASRGIDLTGLTTAQGKTFRWKGRYHDNMNDRDTLEVHVNVLESYSPSLPATYRDSDYVFLGNSSPLLQMNVLDQMRKPKLVLADTMNLYIETQHDELRTLLPRLDGLLLNDSEARLLTGIDNLVRAGEMIRQMGPKFVILKKGEHGAMLFTSGGVSVLPAYPLAEVVDPTGAGDSFAGGLMGALAAEEGTPQAKDDWPIRLRRAMAHGTVAASFTVEDFSLNRLKRLDRPQLHERLDQYRRMLSF